MNYLSLLILFLGILMLILSDLISNIKKDYFKIIIESISWYLIAISFVSVVFLIFNRFDFLLAFIITSLLSALKLVKIIYINVNSSNGIILNKPYKDNYFLIIFCFVIIMLPFVFQRYEYIEMTGDAGVYSVSAIHYAKDGKLSDDLNSREGLSPELKKIYDKDNLLYYNKSENKGSFLPGTYLNESNSSEFYFQFYPVWPLIMANCSGLLGINNMHYVMVLLYVLSIFLFNFILTGLKIDKYIATATTILLGTSPVVIHFSKYPTSEILLLFLTLYATYLILKGQINNLIFSGIVIFLFCLTHISSFLYIPLLLLVVLLMCSRNDFSLAPFVIVSLVGFLISIPYGYFVSKQYFIDIYNGSFGSYKSGVFLVSVFAIMGIISCIYGYRKDICKK